MEQIRRQYESLYVQNWSKVLKCNRQSCLREYISPFRFTLFVLFISVHGSSYISYVLREREIIYQNSGWEKYFGGLQGVYFNPANGEFRLSLLLEIRWFARGWPENVPESIQNDLDLYKFAGCDPGFAPLVKTKQNPWALRMVTLNHSTYSTNCQQ